MRSFRVEGRWSLVSWFLLLLQLEREREREFRLSRYLGGVDRLLGLRGFEFGDIVVGYQGAGILRSMLGE